MDVEQLSEPLGPTIGIWAGAGEIANAQGDIYGTSPTRIIPWGKVSIEQSRLEAALAAGWRFIPGADEGFARIERTAEERACRG